MKNDRKNKGFTLAEAMIATVILGLAATSLISPILSSASLTSEGINMTIAANLASERMERFVTIDRDLIKNDLAGYVQEPQGQIENASGTVYTDPAYQYFSRTAEIRNHPATGGKIVTVIVKHKGRETARLSRLFVE